MSRSSLHESLVVQDLADITAQALPWEQLSGKRVLVTGASGFLGKYLVRTLLQLNSTAKLAAPIQVLGMVKDMARAEQEFVGLTESDHFTLLPWDLSQMDSPHELHTSIVRLFHTYGPGLAEDDGRSFADFAYQAARSAPLTLNSDGSAQRTYCYVADTVTAIFTVLLRGASGTAYNIANVSAEVSILELAQVLVALFPERQLAISRSTPAAHYLPSPHSRLPTSVQRLSELGLVPKVGLNQGFERTVLSLA